MLETALILDFDQVDAKLEMVGVKGLNLIRLTRAGMPVPTGFVVSTAAYLEFVQANQLGKYIQTALSSSPQGQLLAETSTTIRAAFDAVWA
ncbi:MAG: PEP/pyruvate-binding domain-containing protein [Thermoguttaceae bacterium]